MLHRRSVGSRVFLGTDGCGGGGGDGNQSQAVRGEGTMSNVYMHPCTSYLGDRGETKNK